MEILLDGKAVGNHGCDDSYCLHLNRTSVEALALPQLLDLQVNLTDAKYYFFKISCSGCKSFVHMLKFSYRVKDFFKSLP